METPNQNNESADTKSWRTDESLSGEPIPALKVKDGESKTFVFLNEGEKKTHPDFGTSIVFSVEQNKVKHNYYIKENNFSLLRQIKELGDLTGLVVTVSRTGSRKSDTRYTIEKADLAEPVPTQTQETEQAPANTSTEAKEEPAQTQEAAPQEATPQEETFAGAKVTEPEDKNQPVQSEQSN